MKLAAINTIGLTGAELLAAELARYPEIYMLPGQNFITFGSVCYRPHDFSGLPAEEVFESLYKHQYTRSGHCWAGLTKSMGAVLRERYDKARHLEGFRRVFNSRASTLEQYEAYARAFAECVDLNVSGRSYFGFFGHNILLNAPHYPDFLEKAVVLDFTNPLDYWLANIGQRMVWDNYQAIKFWLVNTLYVRRWGSRHPENFETFDIREFSKDRSGFNAKIVERLKSKEDPSQSPPDGFIRYSEAIVSKVERNAVALSKIYGGYQDYELGITIDSWASEFLQDPEINHLLDRYETFWNTTAHTNLDWIGPIEEEIVKRARDFVSIQSTHSLSRWFYHECFTLRSDDWENVESRLEHYLGNVEDEIELPEMPYYARIAIRYLESVASNIIKRAYSAVPIRRTLMYQRLSAPTYQANFKFWQLSEKFAALEMLIDESDLEIAKFAEAR